MEKPKLRARHIGRLAKLAGPAAAAEFYWKSKLGQSGLVKARSKYGPFEIRLGESDYLVALQTFEGREYALDAKRTEKLNALAREMKAKGLQPVIIDAGANVGYSAMFLAKTYPDAVVVAVEPDAACVEQVKRNCAGLNVRAVHGAVWRDDNGVHLEQTDRLSWARQVGEGGATPSFTVKSLLAQVPNAAPLILKMDIEGAEREVCEQAGEELQAFACILIEPHDNMKPGGACLHGLHAALARRRMDTLVRGENLIFYDAALSA